MSSHDIFRSSILYLRSSVFRSIRYPPSVWTLTQRRIVIALIAILLVGLSIQIWRHPINVGDPLPDQSPRGDEIADRLDPNTATADALAAIPSLGEKRARQIVDYRRAFTIQHPGQQPFSQPNDLMRIKGIGIATVANLSPFLTFSKDSKSK